MTLPFRDPAKLLFLDRVTQLYNWWFMAQYLKDRFEWLASRKVPLSVILLDLDNFREVNDTRGRLAGDVVLREVGNLLREGRRKGGYAVRYAGDEFFVFLEGVEIDDAMGIAEEIRARIGAEPIPVAHAPGGIPMHTSVGVASFPVEAQTASGLIDKTRRALAHAKRLGKNRVSRDVGERLPTEQEALRQLHRPRLLGRIRERELFQKLFEEAPAGRNRLVLIDGEHGMGKSRLLAELPDLARAAGLKFVQGGCLAQNRAVPYSALTPLLQEYFDRSPELVAPAAARLSGPKLTALGSVLPVLTPSAGQADAMPAPERRRQLFHGILDLLCLVSEGSPLILLLENLDWADEATLEAFLHLLSREDGRVIICATAVLDRREETEADSKFRPLPSFLSYFQASPRFQRVSLPPLTFLDVGELGTEVLRHSIPARFHQLLFQVSRGVPLLVEETLKGLITRGVLRQEEGAWSFDEVTPEDFPASGDEALARRLENLDPETLEVISEASIVGPDMDLPVLAEVLGKDPGETLDIVDRGRRHGLFERVDPAGDAGEIRFTNERFREMVYDGLDENRRRETHRKVAQVYERLASPDAPEAVGPIAYHFERSDDAGKASFYREKLHALRDWLFSLADVGEPGSGEGGRETGTGGEGAGGGEGGEVGTVKVRIQEASQRFEETEVPVAVQFIKTFTLACKNMRVFPEGSQLVREEVAAASASLYRLMERLQAVTVAENRGALVANGQTIEGKALGTLAQDLLRLFREHGIRSLTFVRGVIDDEVEQTVRILSGPPQKIAPETAQWEKLLTSRGIIHLGVLPAIYLATAKQAAGGPEGDTRLGEDDMRLSAEVFRSLAGAVDNLRLYPPENELNVSLQERLERQAQALLERVPTVTLALADDNIVINGIRPNPKWFGITSPLLHKLMQETGLTSVTLTRGVGREDLQVLLTQLAQPSPDDAMTSVVLARLLEERGITTIQVGSRSYAAARASLQAAGKPGGTETEAGARAGTDEGVLAAPGRSRSEEDRLFEQVAQWLDPSLGGSNLREEEIAAAVDSWLASDRQDLANRLWERLMAALASPMEGTRQRAAAGLNLLLTGASADTLTWLRKQSFEPLEKALLTETSPRVFQWQVRATVEALKLFLNDSDFTRVAGLAEALGKGQAGKPDEKRLVPLAAAAVENMAAAGLFQPLLGALKESDPARREQARAVLAALGEGTLQFVVGIVTKEEDAEVRKIAATLLRSLPGAGLKFIVPQLHPPTPPETTRRIVGVLDLIAPELGPEFFSLLGHADVLVRAEFTGVLSRVRRPAATMFLGRALADPQPHIATGALESVRALQLTELVDPIVRLLRKDAPPDLLKACCACLGHLKHEEAIDPLVDVLRQRPRFLGLVKGFPETVRAAAARALGELPLPQAQDALRAVLKDASLAVRSTARLALARQKQGREPR